MINDHGLQSEGPDNAELATVIHYINNETRKLPPLKQMSTNKRKLFSTDLALVGLAVR